MDKTLSPIKRYIKEHLPYMFARSVYHKVFGAPEAELKLLPLLVDRHRTAVDVGAHAGLYTYEMLKLAGGVVAIEANPNLAARLARLFDGQAEVMFGAASSRSGVVDLRIPKDLPGLATMAHDHLPQGACITTIEVPEFRLDELPLGPVGFIKIDVEGHELEVLRGSTAVLERDRPTLLIEAEERHRPNAVGSLVDFLGAYGYHGFMLDRGIFRSMTHFSVANDQRVDAAMLTALDNGKHLGHYINNFIFIA